MNTSDHGIAFIQRLAEPHPYIAYPMTALLLALMVSYLLRGKSNGPPTLSEMIPHVSNTYLYMSNQASFLSKASQILQKQSLVGFWLGHIRVVFIKGMQNTQTLFRTSPNISSDKFLVIMMSNLHGLTPDDIDKFANDKSGRLKEPAPGTEATPAKERYWAGMHHVVDYLSRSHHANKLAETYDRFFTQHVERFLVGEWTEVALQKFLKRDMAEAAITSLLGPRLFEICPDILDLFWDFDSIAGIVAWGPPKILFKDAWAKRERYTEVCGKYLEEAWERFDWDGPDKDADWEPIFGSRYSREIAKWMKESEFSSRSQAGFVALMNVFGLNSNTIPVCTWLIMEVTRDPDLFKAVREEVESAYETDAVSGKRSINLQKLIALPLLQSVYAESLRLHVSINITREVMQPIVMEGYTIKTGTLLQAPTSIAHADESVWSTEGHPASEFWAGRHLKEVAGVKHFAMAGRPSAFFPFGGGISMCPGRHFAKQEILLTLAMLVSRFDIEFIEWMNEDGTPSDGPPQNDKQYAGAAAQPPDLDMKLRWKRLW